MTVTLSLILPAHNEEDHLVRSVQAADLLLHEFTDKFEIIVVDDGSSDNTRGLPWKALASSHRVRYIRSDRRMGKGSALLTGFRASTGAHVVYTDADLPISPDSLRMCIRLLMDENVDVVVGNRRAVGSCSHGHSSMRRRVASKVFNYGVRILAVPGYRDTQCCLKGLSRSALVNVIGQLTIRGYALDVELIFLLQRMGYDIVQIPIIWNDTRGRRSILRLTWIVFYALLEVAVMRVRHAGTYL